MKRKTQEDIGPSFQITYRRRILWVVFFIDSRQEVLVSFYDRLNSLAKIKPFDPNEHDSDVVQAFAKFVRLYKRNCSTRDRSLPTRTQNTEKWKHTRTQNTEKWKHTRTQNTEKWKHTGKLHLLLEQYCTDLFMDDFEAVVV